MIQTTIPEGGFVTLKVFDLTGAEMQTVVNNFQSPGNHTVSFNGSALPSGIYYYELRFGTMRNVKKMLFLK